MRHVDVTVDNIRVVASPHDDRHADLYTVYVYNTDAGKSYKIGMFEGNLARLLAVLVGGKEFTEFAEALKPYFIRELCPQECRLV